MTNELKNQAENDLNSPKSALTPAKRVDNLIKLRHLLFQVKERVQKEEEELKKVMGEMGVLKLETEDWTLTRYTSRRIKIEDEKELMRFLDDHKVPYDTTTSFTKPSARAAIEFCRSFPGGVPGTSETSDWSLRVTPKKKA